MTNQESSDESGLDPNIFADMYEGKEVSLFNHFEPFDVADRPDWLLAKAKEDGIELSRKGNEFQTGTLQDTEHFITVNIAGHQAGKSIIGD